MLRFFDDLTVPQIGRQLGLAEGSVKRYLSDGIERLERSLGPLEDAQRDGPRGRVQLPRPNVKGQ